MSTGARALSLACALCMMCASCTKTGTQASGPGGRYNGWTQPHVLRWTAGEDISTLNPTLSSQGVVSYLSELTMAWLIRWNRNNEPEPELATEVPTKANGGVGKDGLTITYHIRKGVRWSDGAPFNADDVVWSFKAVLNPANNILGRAGWDRISSIGEPDKYTVIVHLRKPYSPFLETFFSTAAINPCIMPKHLLAALPNINNAPYNALPVGIGPFKYKRWERGIRVELVANPLYFRGAPKLAAIDYEIVSNQNTIVTELQGHQLDLWFPVPPSIFATQLRGMAGFDSISEPGYLFNHLDFNVTSPALRDPVVRLALKYATNRPELIAKIGHGIGILQDQPAPKTAPYWDPNIRVLPFDPARAGALLDRDGWKRGPGGIRRKGGVALSLLTISNTGNTAGDRTIDLLRSYWQQIGVEITVKRYNSALLFDNNGPLYKGRWDVAFFAWGVDAMGDLSNLYACDQIPPNGQNILRWCNARADRAMHDLYAQYEQAGRNKDDAILFEELNKDVPTIVENGRVNIFFFNRDLRNFHPNGVSPFDGFGPVDI
jgi:peptide/nickel transport system substrate-binding protein